MKTLSNYPTKIFLGENDGEKIYLSAPSWDCGWYWGFGYIGNRNCHYHVDGLNKKENVNLYDAFKKHFGDTLVVRGSQLWTLCELFQTFYALKEAAEVLGRGGSHMSTNPCASIIINKDEVTRINKTVLPAIFEEIYKILIPAQDNEKINAKLLKLILKGDTQKVVDFMNEYRITTDDLKDIKGVTDNDHTVIHSMYWKQFHAARKAKEATA